MFKTLLQLLILGFCCCAGAAERLRIATEGAYPPFSFTNEQGQLAGFDVDIAQELCRRLEKECEIIAVPWDDLLPGLAAGRYEVIVASMAKTPERERQAEFTDPYYRTRDVFTGRSDSGVSRISPETVRGKILTTQASTIYADYLRDHYQGVATLRLTKTIPDAFAAVVGREADFVLSDNLSAFQFMRSDAGQSLDIIGAPISINEITEASHIQVRKGNLRLRDSINAALRNLWIDGTYHKINARYFPFDIY
jgi:ABC-type amino acid transport substrate-binding protein